MKPAPFDYVRVQSVDEALRSLECEDGQAKVIAGGQSLGPALNLRLAQPERLVDIRRIPALSEAREARDGILFGSCITHAAIEDGRVPDCTGGLMAQVASAIAYRAVRTRGTLGGSICHADPAADWLTALMLLAATVVVEAHAGRREVPIEQFVSGPYATDLADGELVVGLYVPRLSARARWAYRKFCRKPGEFAEAMAAVLRDDARGLSRAVIGATDGAPHVIADARFLTDVFDAEQAWAAVDGAWPGAGTYERQVRFAILQRAAAGLGRAPA